MSSELRRSYCVFAGSNAGAHPVYAEAARELGRELARRNIGLVYGGGRVGLMGEIADAVKRASGHVVGVIPRALEKAEVAHYGLDELLVVGSMHERKATMARLSSGFIALPGGLGTLEELFEILTWAQLSIHDRPCGVVNVAGYFDPLVALLDHAVEQRFVKPAHRELMLIESSASLLLDRFEELEPTRASKWLEGEI